MIEEIGRINERITVGYDHAQHQPFILASSNMIAFTIKELGTLIYVLHAMQLLPPEKFITLLRESTTLELWKPQENKHV